MPTTLGNGMVFSEAATKEQLNDPTPQLADFDPDKPTSEAPYGYKADGSPYKRRRNGGATPGTPKATRTSTAGNARLAEDAANVLCNLNDIVTIGLTFTGLTTTAGAWNGGQDTFRSQAVAALENDPALCRTILRAGATGGKFALIMAYGMLAVGTVPVAVLELRERQADKERAEAERLNAEYPHG